MPLYEFECVDCAHRFSETMPLSKYEQRQKKGFRCPKCRGRKVEQLVTTVMVETSRKS